MSGDAKGIVQNGNNGNGNGKVRELVLWILGLAIPFLLAVGAALYAGQAAHGERIKGCEVAGASLEKRLDAIDGKLDRLLEGMHK